MVTTISMKSLLHDVHSRRQLTEGEWRLLAGHGLADNDTGVWTTTLASDDLYLADDRLGEDILVEVQEFKTGQRSVCPNAPDGVSIYVDGSWNSRGTTVAVRDCDIVSYAKGCAHTMAILRVRGDAHVLVDSDAFNSQLTELLQ